MKYIIFILFIILSCSYESQENLDVSNYDMPSYNVQDEEIDNILSQDMSELEKIKAIGRYAHFYVNYEITGVYYDPEEIKTLEKGDCAERSTYFGWIIYQYLNLKPVFYRCKINKNYHLYCYIKEYDYYFGLPDKDYKTLKSYTFEQYYKKIEYQLYNY